MTLIELMISMLILTLVCVAWLEIIGIQSAKKEARRREAVERLAGMMDAFMYLYKASAPAPGNYYLADNPRKSQLTKSSFKPLESGQISIRFPDSLSDPDDQSHPPRDLLNLDPIGHRLVVVNNLTSIIPNKEVNQELFDGMASSFIRSSADGWEKKKWLIGLLYDHQGNKSDAGRPFYRLPVCLGM